MYSSLDRDVVKFSIVKKGIVSLGTRLCLVISVRTASFTYHREARIRSKYLAGVHSRLITPRPTRSMVRAFLCRECRTLPGGWSQPVVRNHRGYPIRRLIIHSYSLWCTVGVCVSLGLYMCIYTVYKTTKLNLFVTSIIESNSCLFPYLF